MPVITMGSSNYVQNVKSSIITYCERSDVSKIVKLLITGHFEENIEVLTDNDKLGTTAHPHGIYKDAITKEIRQAAQDNRNSINQKINLLES